MSWDFGMTTTEELQEELQKLELLSHDESLGDTYRSICQFKAKQIGKELAKRKAALESGRSIV